MTNLVKLVLIFVVLVGIVAGVLTAVAHFTGNLDLVPQFLRGEQTTAVVDSVQSAGEAVVNAVK